jgi:hypothetical protein
MAVAETHQEAASSHISDSEKTKAVHRISDNRTLVVTNQRLLKINDWEKREQDIQSVESIRIPSISGVEVTSYGPEGVDTDKLGNAAVLGFVALIGLFLPVAISSLPELVSLLSVLAGLVAGIIGALQVLEAYDTDDGYITINVYTDSKKTDFSVRLPPSKAGFASKLSETVANGQ